MIICSRVFNHSKQLKKDSLSLFDTRKFAVESITDPITKRMFFVPLSNEDSRALVHWAFDSDGSGALFRQNRFDTRHWSKRIHVSSLSHVQQYD